MSHIASLREFFHYSDWARDKLLGVATTLTDEQLDRPFEMGEGSLRATLRHLYGSERLWLERWRGSEQTAFPHAATLTTPDAIWQAARKLAEARNGDLAEWTDDALRRSVTYKLRDGEAVTRLLGDILLHSCTHGIHHRSQALNMLRRVGAPPPKPGLDYVFMKLEETAAPPPALSIGLLRGYFEYGNWAQDRVLAAAARLTDEQLDHNFELGPGTLRRALVHIRDAEQWWLVNWTVGPGGLFPEPEPRISVADLMRTTAECRSHRNTFLGTLTDGDLLRPTTATPRAGVQRTFPLGVTILQLNFHGVHHRAQVLNMLRHVGAEVPALDLIAWVKAGGSALPAAAGPRQGRDEHGGCNS